MNQESKPDLSVQDAIEKIIEAAKDRPVVPFLGAGISIAAGFPTIRFVVQYLAKVDFAIQLGVFEHRFPPELLGGKRAVDMYKQHPSRFLEDFGWPDLGQLDADLWMWLDQEQLTRPGQFRGEGRDKIFQEKEKLERARKERRGRDGEDEPLQDLLANDVFPDPDKAYASAAQDWLDLRDHLRAIVQWTLRHDVAERESGSSAAMLKEWLHWKEWYHGEIPDPEPLLLYGDWEALLDRLCEGSFDLTDLLFTSFEAGRGPTIAHRYLAFLQRKLGMPLVLTTNFDSLLERALQEEGTIAKVFDVHRDANLPDASLVARQFSVLKLHGSAYGLRIGERLRYALDTDTRQEAMQYIPSNALVVVMGFSGSERRIMQLLQAVAREHTLPGKKTRLLWLQGPSRESQLCQELVKDASAHVDLCKISSIDLFLQELYFAFAGGYQASATGYAPLSWRPQGKGLTVPPLSADARVPAVKEIPGNSAAVLINPTSSAEKKQAAKGADQKPTMAAQRAGNRRPVHLFLSRDDPSTSTSWASLAAAAFVADLDFGYHTVWIDLENHHTVEGVVAEFFNKVRLFDPHAPTCALSDLRSARPKNAIQKAVQRMQEVFQRGQYILVLDSVESFGRPQLMHHSMPSYRLFDLAAEVDPKGTLAKKGESLRGEFIWRVKRLKDFITTLLNLEASSKSPFKVHQEYCDSYILVAVDNPRLRHRSDGNPNPKTYDIVLKELVRPLREAKGLLHIGIHVQQESGYEELFQRNSIHRPRDADPSTRLPDTWRKRGRSKTGAERSQCRLRDTLSLLRELQAGKAEAKDFSNEATAAFLGLLSIFRRPRALPMLRSIVERWGLRVIPDAELGASTREVRQAVDSLIKENLTSQNGRFGIVGQWHEGGVIWLFREVHETAYDALTEQLHVTKWIEAWMQGSPAPPDLSAAAALVDGLISITWHLSAARTYYADIFLPTRDISSFYEYLYHRVAAARTITLLLALLDKASSIWVEACAHVRDVLVTAQLGQKTALAENPSLCVLVQMLGVFDPLGKTDSITNAEGLGLALQALRDNALETLLMALKRNERFLRSVATPDTVLALSQQFLDRELDEISGDIFNLCGSAATIRPLKPLGELKALFEGLRFAAHLSKLDFESALESTHWDSREERPAKFLRPSADNLKKHLGAVASELAQADTDTEKLKRCYEKLTRVARCALHLQDMKAGNYVAQSVQKLITHFRTIEGAVGPEARGWVKKARRGALELLCKALQCRWSMWQLLVERNGCIVDKKTQEYKDLGSAEEESVHYEDILRETSESSEEDARHRSSALCLRSRALYLRALFQRAHHYLDLAMAGLSPDRLDHRTSRAIIHLYRAELLALSADHHHPHRSEKAVERIGLDLDSTEKARHITEELLNLVASGKKKIDRAMTELRIAEAMLGGMTHQNIWRIRLDFGWAEIRLEKLLFDFEELFWTRHDLGVPAYLRRSGELEQVVLDGLRRLRNVLDMMPFRDKPKPKGALLVRGEQLIYKLWQQFFVAGALYSAVLKSQHVCSRTASHEETGRQMQLRLLGIAGIAIHGDDAEQYRRRWRLWCNAVRFDQFAKLELELAASLRTDRVGEDIRQQAGWPAPRSMVVGFMAGACTKDRIDQMWDRRRQQDTTRS